MHVFKTWTHSGLRYIAVRSGEGEHVLDEVGRYFGAWQDHAAFRKAQAEGRTNEYAVADGASLAVRR